MKSKNSSSQLESITATNINPIQLEHFTYCLIKSAILLKAQLNKDLEKIGIVGHHIGILLVLLHSGSISQIDLGNKMGVDKATMVKLIDQLEALGLVKRSPCTEDRRIKNIEITNKGEKTLNKARDIKEKVESEFLSDLTKDEQAALLKIIPKLLASKANK